MRDPSKFFMIYETGDNTTVTEGEAVPLDLYYSRATVYGDVWELDPAWYDEETGEIEDYRWPWVENKAEILSGEASMLANPGGTFMYSVWNQWQEEILPDGHELVFDSDMIFRRFLYLPDESTIQVAPIVKILYVSTIAADQSADETITLVGSAQSFGSSNGIEEYRWQVESNGQVIDLPGCEKLCNVPARTLHPGWGQFSFDARDSNGNWSQVDTVNVLIAEVLTRISLPLIQN
jgi:hypothetical protein